MLAFGIKVAWFSLSLAGFVSSIVALPAFADALGRWLVPMLYVFTNLAIQGLFCLGMIWKMNPFEMPRAFCVVQPALLGVSWCFNAALTTCLTLRTSCAILRPAGGVPASPAYIRRRVRWHPGCSFLAVFPMVAFAAYLTLALKFDAIKPANGMFCDVTDPVWVRLLSYAGVPLLLALPSLLLTCLAAFQFYTHSSRNNRSFCHSHNNDHFTPVPLRRQSKFKANNDWQEGKHLKDTSTPAQCDFPDFSIASDPCADQRSMTPSGTIVVAEAIATPPDSLSSASARARMTAGRAPINPGIVKPNMRYHLPLQWHTPSPASSTNALRDSPDAARGQHTPSPLVFAMPPPLDENGQLIPHTTTVSVTPDLSERVYEAAPWLKDEKAYLHQLERANARKHEIHDDDEDYDAVSGSLRWIRNSDDTVSEVKSELEFARAPHCDDLEGLERMPSPVHASTYDAGLTETPIPALARLVWRILFFQFLSAMTQVLATISSLVDMFTRDHPPAPFGTQHVALILVSWAPIIAFGVRLPWRR